MFLINLLLTEQVGLSALSPTPVNSSSALGRPISAMSQPVTTGVVGGPVNGYPAYQNMQLQPSQPPQANGMIPTPFTQSSMPNGHLNNGGSMVPPQQAQDPYYWGQQQQQYQS